MAYLTASGSVKGARVTSTILLVEDKEDDVRLFQDALAESKLGSALYRCRDGVEALNYLKGVPHYNDRERFPFPQVLLLELELPMVSGWELLTFVRTRPEWNSLLVVVLTASLRVDDLRRAYSMKADSFLTKPCRPQDLQSLANTFPNRWVALPDSGQIQLDVRQIANYPHKRNLPLR